MKPKKVALISVVACLAAGAFWYVTRRTPERVCQLTVRTLERGDVDGLIALANPEEIKKLNVNRQAVESILRETLWKKGVIHELRYEHFDGPGFKDDEQFYVYPPKSSGQGMFTVWVLDSPKDGWHLGLTYTLHSTCFSTWPNMPDPGLKYDELALKYGIKGRWMNHIGYVWAGTDLHGLPPTP